MVEERRAAVLAVAAEPARPDRAGRGRGAARGRARRGATGRNHVELLGEHLDLEARRPRGRLALRLPEGAAGAAGARARPVGCSTLLEEQRLHAGDPAGAGARAARSFGTGHAARHRAADLPRARGRALSGGHLRGAARVAPRRTRSSRAPSCRGATRASRPASGARRVRPARTRRASSACTSSTRSRCSRSSSRRSRATSTSGCSRSRRRSCRRSRSRTGW